MTGTEEVARSLRCGRCGASFSVPRIEAAVTCPFCSYRQAVSRHRELRAYEEAVQRRVAAADEQRMVAASLEAWSASAASSPVRNLGVAYGLILGLPLVVAAVLGGLHAAGVLTQRGPGATLAIAGVSYLGVVLYLVWHLASRQRRRQRATRLEQARVACPTCGAPGLLTPGAAVDTCQYCSAALVPTATLMERGVDAARAAQREAALERRRATRLATAKATQLGPLAILMPVMIIGSFVLMLGGTAVGYTVEMLRGNEPFHPAIFLLWAMTIALVGGVVVFVTRRRERRQRLHLVLGDVVRQLGGAVMPAVDQRVAWLNRHWSGDYEQHLLVMTTHLTCSAAVIAGGYPALVDVELSPSRPAPRIDLYLAGWVPEISDGRQPSRRARDATMTALGFHVRETEGGLVARANPELLAAARRDPDVVHVVVPALARLASLAAERGCLAVATDPL